MLRLITLLVLFNLNPHLSVASHSKTVSYIDVSTDQVIKVKFNRNNIRVKFLNSPNWVKYRLIGQGVFDDYRGSKIYLEGRNKLVWRSRKYGRQVTFRRYSHSYRDRNRYNDNNRFQYRDRYNERDSYDRTRPDRQSLEGTWYESSAGRELILIDNRSGIKLKFRGERDWFYFENVSEGLYRDKNGNSYKVLSNSQIRWTDPSGRRSYILEKRSDSINWN